MSPLFLKCIQNNKIIHTLFLRVEDPPKGGESLQGNQQWLYCIEWSVWIKRSPQSCVTEARRTRDFIRTSKWAFTLTHNKECHMIILHITLYWIWIFLICKRVLLCSVYSLIWAFYQSHWLRHAAFRADFVRFLKVANFLSHQNRRFFCKLLC